MEGSLISSLSSPSFSLAALIKPAGLMKVDMSMSLSGYSVGFLTLKSILFPNSSSPSYSVEMGIFRPGNILNTFPVHTENFSVISDISLAISDEIVCSSFVSESILTYNCVNISNPIFSLYAGTRTIEYPVLHIMTSLRDVGLFQLCYVALGEFNLSVGCISPSSNIISHEISSPFLALAGSTPLLQIEQVPNTDFTCFGIAISHPARNSSLLSIFSKCRSFPVISPTYEPVLLSIETGGANALSIVSFKLRVSQNGYMCVFAAFLLETSLQSLTRCANIQALTAASMIHFGSGATGFELHESGRYCVMSMSGNDIILSCGLLGAIEPEPYTPMNLTRIFFVPTRFDLTFSHSGDRFVFIHFALFFLFVFSKSLF